MTVKFKVTKIIDARKDNSEIEVDGIYTGMVSKNRKRVYYTDNAGCNWAFYPGDTCEIIATSKQESKQAFHLAPVYFSDPNHSISVCLIGVGGSGSLVLGRLARLDFALKKLGYLGLDVKVYDEDRVELFNVGRQSFSQNDVGENKAFAMVSKVNRVFGLNWKAEYKHFIPGDDQGEPTYNIYISCTDSSSFRMQFNTYFKTVEVSPGKRNASRFYSRESHIPYYWMDFGNGRDYGQCVLGSRSIEIRAENKGLNLVQELPTIIDLFGDISGFDTEALQGRGCSYADKLNQQDLFINDLVVTPGIVLLQQLFIKKRIHTHGVFCNAETLNSKPLHIKQRRRK